MKKTIFNDILKEIAKSIGNHTNDILKRKQRQSEFIRSYELNAINQMESLTIYKPWKIIFYVIRSQLLRFFILTLLSFDLFIWAMIPVWSIIIYEYYITLKWLEIFNISKIKVMIWTLFAEVLFIMISPLIRKCIWFFISGTWI